MQWEVIGWSLGRLCSISERTPSRIWTETVRRNIIICQEEAGGLDYVIRFTSPSPWGLFTAIPGKPTLSSTCWISNPLQTSHSSTMDTRSLKKHSTLSPRQPPWLCRHIKNSSYMVKQVHICFLLFKGFVWKYFCSCLAYMFLRDQYITVVS